MTKVQVNWSVTLFEETMSTVENRLLAADASGRIAELIANIERLNNAAEDRLQLEQLATICLTLNSKFDVKDLSESQIVRLVELAESILAFQGIDPIDSLESKY